MRLVALAGGTGAAKLLRGLDTFLERGAMTVVGNTGDDAEVWGLHVSPDLDTVCYTLGGLLDEERGWGLRDESFRTLGEMVRFGEPTWFNLGDRDLATHLHRTRLLAEGRSLSEVTAKLAADLGVRHAVLPMSDQPVRTRVLGPDGWLGFQEYFVREKTQVEVLAISPIVGGRAVSGPAGRLMAARGLPVSALGIAQGYAPWLDILIIDDEDAALAPSIEAAGARPVVASTLMTGRVEEMRLARRILETLA